MFSIRGLVTTVSPCGPEEEESSAEFISGIRLE